LTKGIHAEIRRNPPHCKQFDRFRRVAHCIQSLDARSHLGAAEVPVVPRRRHHVLPECREVARYEHQEKQRIDKAGQPQDAEADRNQGFRHPGAPPHPEIEVQAVTGVVRPGVARTGGLCSRLSRDMPGCYPARAGGPWLWSTLVLFLFQAVVVPSGLTTRVQPQRWITIWWWKGHRSTQSFADVFPPRALCFVWCTWQAPAGWVQP